MYPNVFNYTKIHFLYPWKSCSFFASFLPIFKLSVVQYFEFSFHELFSIFFSIFHDDKPSSFYLLRKTNFSMISYCIFFCSCILLYCTYKIYFILAFWKKVLACFFYRVCSWAIWVRGNCFICPSFLIGKIDLIRSNGVAIHQNQYS